MTKLADLFPLNLQAELQHFKEDPSYNPQFQYAQPIDPAFLTKWGNPQAEYVELANHIIDRYVTTHPVNLPKENYDATEIEAATRAYFTELKSVPVPAITFNEHQIARCQVTNSGIVFRPHLELSVPDFEGLLRHEIGSHYLRRYNHHLHGFDNLSNDDQGRTEEGVALLHTYLLHPQPILFKSALRYQAAWLGQTHSFSQVYTHLMDRGISHREAWRATLRTKRGVTDTAQPLAFTKDIMYLEGIIKVIRWLQDPKHQPHNLYQGQLSLAQLETVTLAPAHEVVMPPFMLDLDHYRQQVQTVVNYNGIETHL